MEGYTDATYDAKADDFIEAVSTAMEPFMDEDGSPVDDISLSAGVLNIETKRGTFVLNKQAPRKQLWLSSPLSGPSHYDMSADGTAWTCDKKGTDLSEKLCTELGEVVGETITI
jgi:frataxin